MTMDEGPWYLVLSHDLPLRQPRPDEYIGPFQTEEEAHDHRLFHGPKGSRVTRRLDTAEVDMTPTEHIEYLRSRW